MPTPSDPSLRLELVEPHHAAELQPLAESPEVGATTNLPVPYPADGAELFIRESMAKRANGIEYTFAILRDSRVIGVCGLLDVGGAPLSAELGYWIGRPFWGYGYATAAATLAIQFAFSELGAVRLRASSLDRNAASRRVLEKLGFSLLGYGARPNAKWTEDDLFANFELERHDWFQRHAGP